MQRKKKLHPAIAKYILTIDACVAKCKVFALCKCKIQSFDDWRLRCEMQSFCVVQVPGVKCKVFILCNCKIRNAKFLRCASVKCKVFVLCNCKIRNAKVLRYAIAKCKVFALCNCKIRNAKFLRYAIAKCKIFAQCNCKMQNPTGITTHLISTNFRIDIRISTKNLGK